MAKCALKNLLANIVLLFFVASCSIPPTYSRKNIVDTIKRICRDEFNIEVNAWDIGDTIWVHTPSKIFDETGKWNVIDNTRWSEEVSEQSRKIYSTLQRVLLSIDHPPKFYCFIMSDIDKFGLDWYRIVFIPDIIKYSFEQYAIGYVSSEEINKRFVSFYQQTTQALGDKKGSHIKKYDMSMGEFIALLAKQEIESEFYRQDRRKNFDVNNLDIIYSKGKLDISFEIMIKKYEENLPDPMTKTTEIVKRLLGIYSEFHDIAKTTIRDDFNKKTKELTFPSHKQQKLDVIEQQDYSLVETVRVDFYLQKANEYYHDKNYDKAIDYYHRALNIEANNVNALFGLGNTYFTLGNYKKSLTYYSKILEIDPKYKKIQQNLGLVHLQLGNHKEAIKYLHIALKEEPDNEWIYADIGYAYLYSRQYDLAVKYLLRALDIKPEFIQAYYNLGLAHFYLENYGQAIYNYEKAVEIDPDYFLAYNQLGWTYYILGKYDLAIEYYQKALVYEQEKSQYANAYNNLGLVYSAQKKYKEAIESLQKALAYAPDNFSSYYYLGYVYYVLKNHSQALINFGKAASIQPNDPQIYLYISKIYTELGSNEKARENFQKAKSLFKKKENHVLSEDLLDYFNKYSDQYQ